MLLVDDSMLELRAWTRELEADGRRVCKAENLAEALAVAQAEAPDVAIVDVFLGREDGIEVVRQLKVLYPKLFVVAVSGDMSVAFAMAAVRAGADDVIVKPIIASELVRRIERGEPSVDEPPHKKCLTLEEVEWEHISRALLETGRNITQTAERLGIYRQTLQRKLRKRARTDEGNPNDPDTDDDELADAASGSEPGKP